MDTHRTRLAPSPTGALHLGNARTFLLNWLMARQAGGTVVLRMDDLDGPRVKPETAGEALADLRWLGLDWDEGPDIGGPHAPYVQTLRQDIYDERLEDLRLSDRVYACVCSRKEVEAAMSAPHGPDGPVYPGTCRGVYTDAEDAQVKTGRDAAWRFHVHEKETVFEDLYHGTVDACVYEESGDFIVAKKDGTPAYQLACVCDDHEMQVTHVVRGDDLLPSTHRQLLLFEALGFPPPRFCHFPLVVGEDGRRLAKRHGDTRLSKFRDDGVAPERIVGWLAHVSGLRPDPAPVSAPELVAGFDPARVPGAPVVWRGELP